jgi:hypothetical protein
MSAVHKQFKMAAVTDARLKQSAVTEFLTAEELSPTQTHRRLNSACGQHTGGVSAVRPLVWHCKSGETDRRPAPKWPTCDVIDSGQQEPC